MISISESKISRQTEVHSVKQKLKLQLKSDTPHQIFLLAMRQIIIVPVDPGLPFRRVGTDFIREEFIHHHPDKSVDEGACNEVR